MFRILRPCNGSVTNRLLVSHQKQTNAGYGYTLFYFLKMFVGSLGPRSMFGNKFETCGVKFVVYPLHIHFFKLKWSKRGRAMILALSSGHLVGDEFM